MPNANVSPKDLPNHLSNDLEVISAMKSIQRAGFWSVGIGIVSIVSLVMYLLTTGDPSAIVIYSAIASYFLIAGSKMNKLEGNNLKTLLVINVILSLILVVGIFPILSLITSGIALSKFKYFKSWKQQQVTA